MTEKDVQLDTVRVRVRLADETEHVLTIENPELCRWEAVRADKGWPAMKDAPITWMTFVSWARMKRAGLYSSEFPQFRDHDCIDVGDAEEGEPADPTLQAAERDSPSVSPAEPAST